MSTLTGYLVGPEGAIVLIAVDDPPPTTWTVNRPKPIEPKPPGKYSLKDAMERVGKHVTTPIETLVYHKVHGIKSLVYVQDERQAWSMVETEK